jgi:soluble lytic murein transglycosylase-like protein
MMYGLVLIAIGLALVWKRDTITTTLPASNGFDFTVTRNDVRKTIRQGATNGGYDPDWFDAIAKGESNWKLDIVNNAGPDARYGGAYGCMQMTATTAKALGYDPQTFLSDAAIMAQAAVDNLNSIHPATFEDACVYWNGGVATGYASIGALDEVKQAKLELYVANAQRNLDWVKENPPT